MKHIGKPIRTMALLIMALFFVQRIKGYDPTDICKDDFDFLSSSLESVRDIENEDMSYGSGEYTIISHWNKYLNQHTSLDNAEWKLYKMGQNGA